MASVGFAVNVINTYFDVYFPRAADLADAMRKLPGGRRFIYTTHPWLVDLYTNCPELSGFPGDGTLHCPNQTMLSKVESAIRRGDIVWHAFPFNAEPEIYDARLFVDAIQIARRLKYFAHY
jgi:hypothetical protein